MRTDKRKGRDSQENPKFDKKGGKGKGRQEKPKFEKGGNKPVRDKTERSEKPSFKRTSRPKKASKYLKPLSDSVRLNRYIANAGVCSRREADTYIKAGVVTINGKAITELGTKVQPGDEVKFDGRKLNPEKKVYLLLNKPKDFVTTTDDPHADKTVMDLVKSACTERIYPVGRLDKNTTGLLLFTNDGDLSKRLTHPSYQKKKIYQVSLDKPITKQHVEQIANGIELEDGPIFADAISYIDNVMKNEIGIEIHSGKNRIIRRIFEHFGYHVRKLDRVYFAGLTKKNLPRGKWRLLTPSEIRFLKMNG